MNYSSVSKTLRSRDEHSYQSFGHLVESKLFLHNEMLVVFQWLVDETVDKGKSQEEDN